MKRNRKVLRLGMPHLIIPVSENDHMSDGQDAPITIVEYGDYQCPFSAKAHPVLKDLLRRMQGIRLVFRHFPLKQSHPFAVPTAEIVEAASLQGKFWQLHDFIYENPHLISSENFIEQLRQFDLDLEKIKKDRKTELVRNKIEHDFQGGILSGVNGTPSLYINEELYDGAINLESLSQALTAKFLF